MRFSIEPQRQGPTFVIESDYETRSVTFVAGGRLWTLTANEATALGNVLQTVADDLSAEDGDFR